MGRAKQSETPLQFRFVMQGLATKGITQVCPMMALNTMTKSLGPFSQERKSFSSFSTLPATRYFITASY
jgi:hypothetical protein